MNFPSLVTGVESTLVCSNSWCLSIELANISLGFFLLQDWREVAEDMLRFDLPNYMFEIPPEGEELNYK